MDIGVEQWHAESAPGQFEISLAYGGAMEVRVAGVGGRVRLAMGWGWGSGGQGGAGWGAAAGGGVGAGAGGRPEGQGRGRPMEKAACNPRPWYHHMSALGWWGPRPRTSFSCLGPSR